MFNRLLILSLSVLAFASFAAADESYDDRCPPPGCPVYLTCYKNYGALSDGSTQCMKIQGYFPYGSTCTSVGYTGAGACLIPVEQAAQADQTEQTEEAPLEINQTDPTKYYGNRDGANMSGSTGRTVAAKAKLDVCWNSGYSKVDQFGSGAVCVDACSTASNTSCIGLTGAESCESRCSAVYGR